MACQSVYYRIKWRFPKIKSRAPLECAQRVRGEPPPGHSLHRCPPAQPLLASFLGLPGPVGQAGSPTARPFRPRLSGEVTCVGVPGGGGAGGARRGGSRRVSARSGARGRRQDSRVPGLAEGWRGCREHEVPCAEGTPGGIAQAGTTWLAVG